MVVYGTYGYGAYVGRPVYMFAPSAKIISIDSDDCSSVAA